MFLYLVLKRQNLLDMRAAINLFKEVHRAKLRGYGYGLGLVYATDHPVSQTDQDTLGLVDWI